MGGGRDCGQEKDEAIDESAVEEEEEEENARERLASLIVYTLALVVVCLAAFNFYLLVWIWSSLRDGRQLDLLSSWDEFRIKGKLVSRHQFHVDQISAKSDQAENLQIVSASIVEFHDSQANSASNLMELSKAGDCSFASGLQVRGLSSGRVALFCPHHHHHQHHHRQSIKRSADFQDEDQDGAGCLVDEQTTVRLTHSKGVDFRRKSVQTNRIKTKRLHSALNELHLMGSNESSFESFEGTIRVHSMDDLIFASKRTNVIMEAKTINVSSALQDTTRAANGRARGYKLCICLEAKRTSSVDNDTARPAHKLGRLFAIGAGLRCGKFSASFCRPAPRNDHHQQQQQQRH